MFIGIDMGGTKIAGGLVRNGRIIKRVTLPTGASKGKKHVIGQLLAVIDELAEGQKIEGIGIGVPGLYNGTKIELLHNVPALNGVDLKKELKLNVPLILENDAKCFAIAEHAHGAGKRKQNMVGLILGTGVGSGIIIDGKLYRGSRGFAGEVGEIVLPDGTTWESIISGPAIIKAHQRRGGSEDRFSLIWKSASKQSKQTRDETIENVARFAENLIAAFDPDVIVLGGGVSTVPIVAPVNAILKKRGFKPILKQNELGVEGAILGAVEAFNHE